MRIGNKDFYLDLLFYHRALRRLVAVELKLGAFDAAYKGQMELYLRWLDKHERKGESEESPLGLILCSELPDRHLLRTTLAAAVRRAHDQFPDADELPGRKTE
jgi:hypothetical protein